MAKAAAVRYDCPITGCDATGYVARSGLADHLRNRHLLDDYATTDAIEAAAARVAISGRPARRYERVRVRLGRKYETIYVEVVSAPEDGQPYLIGYEVDVHARCTRPQIRAIPSGQVAKRQPLRLAYTAGQPYLVPKDVR